MVTRRSLKKRSAARVACEFFTPKICTSGILPIPLPPLIESPCRLLRRRDSGSRAARAGGELGVAGRAERQLSHSKKRTHFSITRLFSASQKKTAPGGIGFVL